MALVSVAQNKSDVVTTLEETSCPEHALAAAAVNDVHTHTSVADRPSLAQALWLMPSNNGNADDVASDDMTVIVIEPVLTALVVQTLLKYNPGPA